MVRYFLVALLPVLLFSCGGKSVSNSEDLSDSAPRAQSLDVSDGAHARMVTYSASLDLSVKSPDETKNALVARVKSDSGFIVRETERSIVARVPVANMDNFIKYAKTLGNVKNETKTGTDITDRYRDDAIRLNSLKALRDRYLALLEKAEAVGDVLEIEKELGRVNMEIEVFEGKIKFAESSVAYSSINVSFRERVRPGPVGWVFYGLYHGVKWFFVW